MRSMPCSRLGRAGEVSDPAGLGLARLLLGGNGPDELEEFVRTTPGPGPRLRRATADTRLAETLEAWFDAGGALRETADRLHIHPNTVTQRLERVGQLLGDRLARTGRGTSTCSWRCRWSACARQCVIRTT